MVVLIKSMYTSFDTEQNRKALRQNVEKYTMKNMLSGHLSGVFRKLCSAIPNGMCFLHS